MGIGVIVVICYYSGELELQLICLIISYVSLFRLWGVRSVDFFFFITRVVVNYCLGILSYRLVTNSCISFHIIHIILIVSILIFPLLLLTFLFFPITITNPPLHHKHLHLLIPFHHQTPHISQLRKHQPLLTLRIKEIVYFRHIEIFINTLE